MGAEATRRLVSPVEGAPEIGWLRQLDRSAGHGDGKEKSSAGHRPRLGEWKRIVSITARSPLDQLRKSMCT